MKKLSIQFCKFDLIVGLETVFMFRLIEIFVFFIWKIATSIERSGVISIVKMVFQKGTLTIRRMSRRVLKTKVKILCTFHVLCQGVPTGDKPVTD